MDFIETMRQAHRLCELTSRRGGCKACRLAAQNNGTNYGCYSLCVERPEIYASIVEKWARENPEPIYPTWEEWLVDNDLAVKRISDIELSIVVLTTKATQQIPPETAERLGIPPIK